MKCHNGLPSIMAYPKWAAALTDGPSSNPARVVFCLLLFGCCDRLEKSAIMLSATLNQKSFAETLISG